MVLPFQEVVGMLGVAMPKYANLAAMLLVASQADQIGEFNGGMRTQLFWKKFNPLTDGYNPISS